MGQPTAFSSLAVLQQAQQQPAQSLPSTSSLGAVGNGSTDGQQHNDGTQPPEKKKRRRTAEDGKRYACDHEGCGKGALAVLSLELGRAPRRSQLHTQLHLLAELEAATRRGLTRPTAHLYFLPSTAFSRPDHLSRHKLNHNPTTVYECTKCVLSPFSTSPSTLFG